MSGKDLHSAEAEDNMRTVACTEQKGYELNGRVIRPAFVLVH